ncbi:MAG: ATP-binding cassette domain-containing protein [Muribaculum sp.]|nr:ATP-binding cassette domain-containing protein [Muribaculum sp.]
MNNLLEIKNLVKDYPGHRALDDVSLNVVEGTVHGLLGPNGAGKSTMIRIINQIITQDSGTVSLNGRTMTQEDVRHLGYLPEERGLYKKMKVLDHIVFLGRLKGMTKGDAVSEGRKWLEKMGLEEWTGKRIEALSKGMAQKVQFIGTVIHRPELLIFDEPFSGFDPVNAELLKQEILELNRNGSTILFSTHNMSSVEAVCSNISLINKSKVVLEGEVHQLQEQKKKHLYRIRVTEDIVAPADGLFTIQEISQTGAGGCAAVVKLLPGVEFRDAVDHLNHNYTLRGFDEILPTMNEIFIETVTGTEAETPSILQ